MSHRMTVSIVSSRHVSLWISTAIDHVVPSLKPYKTRELKALRSIVIRHNPLDVGKNMPDVFYHETIIDTGCHLFLRPHRLNIFTLLSEIR